MPRLTSPLYRVVTLSLATALGAGCSDDPPTVDRVVEAMGGEKVSTVVVEQVESTGQRFEPGEGLHPDKPLFMSDFSLKRSAATDGPRLRQELTIDAKSVLPQRVTFTETINGQVGYVQGVDNIFGAESPESPVFSPRVAGQLRHTELSSPLRLIRYAHANPTAVSERPEAKFDGRDHRVLALSTPGAPEVRLFIDKKTDLISKAETLENHPPMGDTAVEFLFKDYRSADGVMVPFDVSVLVDGKAVHSEKRARAQALATVEDSVFNVPQPFHMPHFEESAARARASSQWYSGFLYGAFSFFYYDQSGSEVEDVLLAPGVHYLRGPSHHNLLVELQDSLLIVDAPMYVGRTASVLAHLKEKWPNKPLRHVVASHFHQDHVGGIREFAAEGNMIVHVGSPTEQHFKKVFTNPHTVQPDRLHLNPKPVTVRAVEAFARVEDPVRPVELYRIANSHAEDMLIVYLPTEKLLFTADIFGPNPYTNGQLLEGEYRQWAGDLYREVTRLQLDVRTVVGAHGEGTATLADVKVGAGL